MTKKQNRSNFPGHELSLRPTRSHRGMRPAHDLFDTACMQARKDQPSAAAKHELLVEERVRYRFFTRLLENR